MTIEVNGSEDIEFGTATELAFERTDAFSVSVRAQSRPNGSAQILIGRYQRGDSTRRGWNLALDGDLFRVQLISDWFAGNRIQKQINYDVTGGWGHYVFTYDGSSNTSGCNLYFNGIPPTSTSAPYNALSATIVGTADAFACADSTGNRLDGNIDECAIYDKELSAAEVETIYGGVHYVPDLLEVGPFANIVGYWRMGKGATFPTIPDVSANSNDGTMTGLAGELSYVGAPTAAVDLVRPVIGNHDPVIGSALNPDSSVEFDVTDDQGSFASVVLMVDQLGTMEVIHNGSAFVGRYQDSSRVIIAGGFRYTVIRSGGWVSGPDFLIRSVDAAGNPNL